MGVKVAGGLAACLMWGWVIRGWLSEFGRLRGASAGGGWKSFHSNSREYNPAFPSSINQKNTYNLF